MPSNNKSTDYRIQNLELELDPKIRLATFQPKLPRIPLKQGMYIMNTVSDISREQYHYSAENLSFTWHENPELHITADDNRSKDWSAVEFRPAKCAGAATSSQEEYGIIVDDKGSKVELDNLESLKTLEINPALRTRAVHLGYVFLTQEPDKVDYIESTTEKMYEWAASRILDSRNCFHENGGSWWVVNSYAKARDMPWWDATKPFLNRFENLGLDKEKFVEFWSNKLLNQQESPRALPPTFVAEKKFDAGLCKLPPRDAVDASNVFIGCLPHCGTGYDSSTCKTCADAAKTDMFANAINMRFDAHLLPNNTMWDAEVKAYLESNKNQKLFGTLHTLGYGPQDMQCHDSIWLLEGQSTAFVLRRIDRSQDIKYSERLLELDKDAKQAFAELNDIPWGFGSRYKIIGTCYMFNPLQHLFLCTKCEMAMRDRNLPWVTIEVA
jgi:hypothetical protein